MKTVKKIVSEKVLEKLYTWIPYIGSVREKVRSWIESTNSGHQECFLSNECDFE